MPINNITQTISELPAAGKRGIDVQTIFVTKQEDFQDHLQGTTVDELNALVEQQNTMAEAMNSTATQVNTNANIATTKAGEANTSASSANTSASEALTSRNQAETFKNSANTSASTATTKAGEASASALSANTSASQALTKAGEASASALSANTSASQALTSRNQAETFAQQAQASAESVDVNNLVHRTGDETIAGIKNFSLSPIVPTPTSDTEATNKAYVDAKTVATAIPIGTIITVAKNTAPTGYLKANGALLSRTTYSALFAAIGTTFGAGDGSTTFALPDLRAYFPRGWDDGRGIDTGRVFGSNQADGYLNHSHTGSTDSQGAHTHTINSGGDTSSGMARNGSNGGYIWTVPTTSAGAHTHTVTVATSTTGTTETRPKNIALLYCIKY